MALCRILVVQCTCIIIRDETNNHVWGDFCESFLRLLMHGCIFIGVDFYVFVCFVFYGFVIYWLLSTGKYIDDFKFVQGKEMHFGKVLEFDGVSVDQCAKLCIEEESVNCQTFAYCGNYTKCKLMSSTPKHLEPGYITSSDFCNLYISK